MTYLVKSDQQGRTSVDALIREVMVAINSGISVIQVRVADPEKASDILRKYFVGRRQIHFWEWNLTQGARADMSPSKAENSIAHYGTTLKAGIVEASEQALQALRENAMKRLQSDEVFVYMIQSWHGALEQPKALQALQSASNGLSRFGGFIVLVTPDEDLRLPDDAYALVREQPPTHSELSRTLSSFLASLEGTGATTRTQLTQSQSDLLCSTGLGMTLRAFEQCLATGVSRYIEEQETAGQPAPVDLPYATLMDAVSLGKVEIVSRSSILSLSQPESMGNVGGMGRFKRWIEDRREAFLGTGEALDFGLRPPRGVFLAGTPGSGKSLAAKAAASALNVPLISMNLSAVYGKFVGDSENSMRSALRMVEGMGPIVLLVDEVDKALGGSGGATDSGVSARVLGILLTWMQERNRNALVVMTANRVRNLPPELMRRGGRMDQLFYVGLPSRSARADILAIHLALRGRDKLSDVLSQSELQDYVRLTTGFSAAEIAQSVDDALILAFRREVDDVEYADLRRAVGAIAPMSITHKDSIAEIEEWSAHAVSASYDDETDDGDDDQDDDEATDPTPVVRRTRR